MIEKKNVEIVHLDKYDIEQIKKEIDFGRKLFSKFQDDLIFWDRLIEALTSGDFVLLLYRTKGQDFNIVSYSDLHSYSDFMTTFNPGVRQTLEKYTTTRGKFVSYTGFDENNYLFIREGMQDADKIQKYIQQLK